MDSSSDGLARILGHHEVRPRPRAVRGGGIGGSAASKLRRRKARYGRRIAIQGWLLWWVLWWVLWACERLDRWSFDHLSRSYHCAQTGNIGDDGAWSGERLSWVEGVKHVITIAQNMTDNAPRRWLEVCRSKSFGIRFFFFFFCCCCVVLIRNGNG